MRKLQITQLAAMNMHYSRYSIDAFLDSAAGWALPNWSFGAARRTFSIRPSAGRLPPRFAGWRRTGG